MEAMQPEFGKTNLTFWLSERVFKTHNVIYVIALLAWATAVAFVPGDWSLFWPIMIWTIVFMIHFLVFKGTHVDDEWVEERVERLNEAGVPCGPVLDLGQVFRDPQVLARQMMVELPHPERGTIRATGLPVKLSDTPGAIERRPPLHGEHTEEVLRGLGLSADEVADLRARGIL